MILNPSKLVFSVSRRPCNMSLIHGDTGDVLYNRENFLKRLGIDYRDLVCARQIHGSNIHYARRQDRGCGAVSVDNAIEGTDALITNIQNLPLAVFTADCLPVFLYDEINNAIGLVHAGWRGAKERIISKTVEAMREKFSTDPARLSAGLGPCIRSCCYEVSDDFYGYFEQGIIKCGDRCYLDLPDISRGQLTHSGIKAENIIDFGECTFCNDIRYFSHRKHPGSGRMMSVLMLK